MGKAGSIPVEFQTLPVLGYDNIDGQDVNIIDPALIKKTVHTAFGVQATPPSPARSTPTSTVDVVNAGGATGMAAKGFAKSTIGNAAYSAAPARSSTTAPAPIPTPPRPPTCSADYRPRPRKPWTQDISR